MAKKSNCIYYDYYWYHRESSRSMMKRFMPSHGVVSVVSLRLSGFLTVLLLVFCSNTLVLAQTTEETYSSEKDKSTTSANVSENAVAHDIAGELAPAMILESAINTVSQLITIIEKELADIAGEAHDLNTSVSDLEHNEQRRKHFVLKLQDYRSRLDSLNEEKIALLERHELDKEEPNPLLESEKEEEVK